MSNNPNRSWLHSNPTISSTLLIQHQSNSFNSIQTSTTTTTTRRTTISSHSSDSDLPNHHQSNSNSHESIHTSIGLNFPPPPPPPERPLLSPLLALAAYAALAMAALTGLAAVLLTGYGLSAFDDARRRLTGVVSAYHPSRYNPSQSSNSTSGTPPETSQHDRFPPSVRTSARTQPAGYNVQTPMESSEESDEKGSTEGSGGVGSGTRRTTQEETAADCNTAELHPPRPPLTVLVGSVILTLIIVAVRLMVMWWMGQQVPKNTTRAFQNGRRAYEAANRRNLYQTRSMW
ncbi:uncharacterized protein MELLADRAFT_70516 [Melampsora larici-populina 98AG31]|uniref:Uncharacterized protein n=1 Tax=Melampsora larici-populina (strain 98AG31 / pathotype 3-4-7) TaxID=747676 RepID=F4R4I0_MELLP|nr:uncharacterized protein MELLADRAFT_70516 [Melampsora larici-populina 98AG31]EGG12997.1 hypothetical protein MELLADRAFT_70516 [Melampsora larici-populina 98AG31]